MEKFEKKMEKTSLQKLLAWRINNNSEYTSLQIFMSNFFKKK